jgi:acyl-coenzyme A synthetase/AMP-(fatty) acid ligase
MAIDLRYTREFAYDHNDEASLAKELVLQVRKVIGPFASPKKIFIVSDLPKTRSGKASPGLYLAQHSFND